MARRPARGNSIFSAAHIGFEGRTFRAYFGSSRSRSLSSFDPLNPLGQAGRNGWSPAIGETQPFQFVFRAGYIRKRIDHGDHTVRLS